MSFGEITTSDLTHWQYRGAEVLADLVKEGHKAGRHPLDWTLTSSGSLRGEVNAVDGLSRNDRHAVYEEWRNILNASDPREARGFGGGTRLTATFSRATNRGDVRGALVLDLSIDAPGDEDHEDYA